VWAAKLLATLLLPLHASLLLGLAALGLAARRRPRAALAASALALSTLWAASTPRLAVALVSSLEARFPPVAPADSPPADAIVVLGGSLASTRPPRLGPELVDASDRVLHAARLYRAGKAPLVVPSGGQLIADPRFPKEAEEMASLLVEWGVPRGALLLEASARTTHENARDTAALLRSRGARRALLVTSALHMERALRTFRAAGVDAIPAPCDYAGIRTEGSVLSFLPSPGALATTHAALWERIGLVYYRLRGFSS